MGCCMSTYKLNSIHDDICEIEHSNYKTIKQFESVSNSNIVNTYSNRVF